MANKTPHSENGQNIVLYLVIIIVIIALAGLAIDGGFALSNRRRAQNAADSGALAGAAIICQGGTTTDAETKAREYAITRNKANSATVSFNSEIITVTTAIPQKTFLAGIFGTNVVTATATASAGCYVPCDVTGVLPVAWACQPPAGVPGANVCGIQYGTDNTPGPLYIIMDSQKTGVDLYCQDPPNSCNNTINPNCPLDCDLNNDGINDLFTGGNRSWLDLNGLGGGAADLRNWIWNGFPGNLRIHTWFGGQAGVADSVFQAVGDVMGRIVWLPVFDSYCNGYPSTVCPSEYHTNLPVPPFTGGNDIITYTSGSQTYFHVINFSAFKITCVVAPGVPHTCSHPGRDAAQAANPLLKWNSIKTIEGYFIQETGGSGKCQGPDAGVHTIYLNH